MPDAAKGPGMTPRMWLKTGIRKIINNQLQWGRDDSPDVTSKTECKIFSIARFNGAGDDSLDVTPGCRRGRARSNSFNGAGDHSPDVTPFPEIRMVSL